jgi:hypothetical protein
MPAGGKVDALQGLARIYKERKDWPNVFKYCAEIVRVLPQAPTSLPQAQCQAKLQLLLADAEEGRGNLRRAREHDEEAKRRWRESGQDILSVEMVAYFRRKAIERLRAGNHLEAFDLLKHVPLIYKHTFEFSGVNFMTYHCLRPIMAALEVLASTLEDTRVGENVLFALAIQRRRRLFWQGIGKGSRKRRGASSECNGGERWLLLR